MREGTAYGVDDVLGVGQRVDWYRTEPAVAGDIRDADPCILEPGPHRGGGYVARAPVHDAGSGAAPEFEVGGVADEVGKSVARGHVSLIATGDASTPQASRVTASGSAVLA